MLDRNRCAQLDNRFQLDYEKVLCVCSAGLLRSPTAASVLSALGYNTRSCGIADYALIPLTDDLLYWADTIVCFEQGHFITINKMLEHLEEDRMVLNMNIPDQFSYKDQKLIEAITDTWNAFLESRK